MSENSSITLPLLITRGFIAFPNNISSIEAARDFSTKAIEVSRNEQSSLILIVAQKDPSIDNPSLDDIYSVGSLCRITSFSDQKKYVRIRLSCSNRVALSNVRLENGTYVADFTILEDVYDDKNEEIALIRTISKCLEDIPELSRNIPKSVLGQLGKGVDSSNFADLLINVLPMSLEQRQLMLETLNVNERLRLVLNVIKTEKEIAAIDQKLTENVRNSAEKAQKEYYLREKMKAIKQELGEDTEDDNILDKLEKNPYPDSVKAKIKSELKRYESMPQASLESSLIKQYIDILMSVPWYQKTDDNDDLVNAERILDEDHYGLEKVKKRIVEYLAVKKLTKSLKAPILCFYGPPGVGKTSLGLSIARALGRKFFKAALGGISDEAEIRGHRRTYVGSMPGRIINGLRRCGTRNPVILLDEVDKLGNSQKGDPANALLEVLDPEQNFAFNDNYLEEPYDLSDVLFICTANYLENIPAPLRDRLELIELNSYTEIEKLRIAKEFLLDKVLKVNGLDADKLSISDEAYLYLIRRYTREAGVRELQRLLSSIVRKVIVEFLKDENFTKIEITPNKIREYLGVEIFDDSVKEKVNQIGVVTGLAYTEFGGDILPIEVNYFPGKGGLILTGKLGEVMKESASIALDFVKSNADKYDIDSKIFAENDIHIHVPEGAVPKDGPSAGVAMTIAIISCLSKKPVDCNVAMTGEVTLRGNALPIGGLREKSLAALRSGIKTIIVPFENAKAVEELPLEIKSQLKIVFMKNVDDAYKVAIVQE